MKRLYARGTLFLIAAALVLRAGAADEPVRSWNTASGTFSDPACWHPAGVPTPDAAACFERTGTYTVRFTGDTVTRAARFGSRQIAGHREITLDLGGNTYTLAQKHYRAFTVGPGRTTLRGQFYARRRRMREFRSCASLEVTLPF